MSARSEGRSLAWRIAVGSLVAFLATGVGVAAVMSGAVRGQEESGATFHARTVALEVVQPLLHPSDLARPVTGERYQQLRALIASRVLADGRIIRVKVWRLDGTVVFSDDPGVVGKRFTGEADLRLVGAGEYVSGVSDLDEPENAGDRRLGAKLFETYVPLRPDPRGPVVAAIELYQSYGYVQEEIDHLLTTLAAVFGGGLAALYLVLMPIVLTTSRRLRERNDRLARQASDLREAEAKYRALVEPLPAIVYAAEFETGGRWLYVSPQIEQILGFAPEEWITDPTLFDRQLHPEDVERYRAAEAQGRLAGGQLGVEYRMLAQDGRVVWFRDDAVVITDDAGRPRFQQGVMFDITESKRAEEALRGALELEQEAAERLRALDHMRNSFLAAVSHELRTPLTSVLGFAVTLQRADVELSAQERVEMLDRLVANAWKLERLLTDLLDMDRISRGVLEPRLGPVDMGELVHRVADETDVGGRFLQVDVAPLEVLADGAKVERIVENLVVNASRHTPEGSHIWVRVTPVEDGIAITVEDDGPGVPDDMKGSVFLPFHQGARINEHHPGTGIGLSLVADFARLHGGRAWVEDRAGGGASFRVFLRSAALPVGAPS
jgi:PAS domain S-box-containing protein